MGMEYGYRSVMEIRSKSVMELARMRGMSNMETGGMETSLLWLSWTQ